MGAAALAVSAAAYSVLQMMAGAGDASAAVGSNLLESALLRTVALPMLPIAALTVAPAALIGIWAGRMRLLELPDRYRPLLRRAVLIGFPVSALGAQPVALQAVGVWAPGTPGAGVLALVVFSVTGIAGGIAFAAAIALLANRIGDRRGRVTSALVACGRRSMTFYIAQSPVWLVATEPSLLGLGGRLGVVTAAGVAVATWFATLVIADALQRADRRGPAEALLRYLTYRARAPRPALAKQ